MKRRRKLKGWEGFPAATSRRFRKARRHNRMLLRKARRMMKKCRNKLKGLARRARFDGYFSKKHTEHLILSE